MHLSIYRINSVDPDRSTPCPWPDRSSHALSLARSIYAMPCLGPISKKGFCSIAKRDEDDQMGTTVVAYIYKNKYYFVADSRLSTVRFDEDKMMKNYSINSDVYTKFTKFGVDFYAIMSGAKSVMEKLFGELATYFESQTDQISVKDFAVVASDYLIRYGNAKKAQIGLEPGDKKSEAYKKWIYETNRWEQRYGHSAAFICGYENKVPKIYVSRYCYRVPLDISREYTTDQILEGVTEEEALRATIKDHPPYFVLGSSRKVVIEFMSQKSKLFERHRISFRGGHVHRDDIFDDISMELARAVVGAAIVDLHTGGEVHVRGICRGGRTLFFDCDVARVYLESYASLGGVPDLLVFVPILACGGIGHGSIRSFLGSLGSPKMKHFHRLGSIRGFGMHVVAFEDGVPDANIQIIYDKILKKAKGWGKLGLPEVRIGNMAMQVCSPRLNPKDIGSILEVCF